MSSKDIETIYFIYNRLLTIKSLLDENEVDMEKLKFHVKEFADLVFTTNIPKARINTNYGNIEKLLNRECSTLLRKVNLATFKRSIVSIKTENEKKKISIGKSPFFEGYEKDNNINGVGKLYNSNELLKYQGEFIDGILVSGIAKEYAADGSILYETEYKNGEK